MLPVKIILSIIIGTIVVPMALCLQESQTLTLHLRTRVEQPKGSEKWQERIVSKKFDTTKIAFLLCDMWEKHWCKTFSERASKIAYRVAPVVEILRDRGVKIIHAPSDCMAFYKKANDLISLPIVRLINFPLLQHGLVHACPDQPPCKEHIAWRRQHPAIRIAKKDLISTNGDQIYKFLQQHKITLLIIVGVATNMCVLGRSFGIRPMLKRGVPVVLVRDLTSAFYNPAQYPYVSQDEATELVVQWIEKYYCPSILSENLKIK